MAQIRRIRFPLLLGLATLACGPSETPSHFSSESTDALSEPAGGSGPAQKTQPLAQWVPTGFQEELVFSGLTEPVAIRFAPDGRVLVAEKSGVILAYDGVNSASSPSVVVDLRTGTHNFWDRGLLGLAVHPQFPSVPELYALYTFDAHADGSFPRWGVAAQTADACPNPPGATEDGCVVFGRLSRIDVDPQTLLGVETPLLSGNWCQQYPSHSVGDVVFSDDGFLYVSAGDGANFNQADWGQFAGNPCSDPSGEGGALRSQDLLSSGDPITYDGTILRYRVQNGQLEVPTDNPLRGGATVEDDAIVAIGLRNPFRLAPRPGTSEVWIGDVGWNEWEEVNRVESFTQVTNFGWPCYEGSGVQSAYSSRALCQQLYAAVPSGMQLQPPHYAYRHADPVATGDGCGTGSSAVTGLAFNDGGVYPASYDGALFFGDSSRQCVWAMLADGAGVPDPSSRSVFVRKASGRVVDVKMGPDGFVYYVDYDGGNVYRVAYYPDNTPPIAAVSASATSGASPLLVLLDASGSSDAEDGTNLDFAWDLDADGNFDDGSGATTSTTFTQPGTHVVRVRVTDADGESAIASVAISVDNLPPVVVIDAPTEDIGWSVGESVDFFGSATDPESGLLSPEHLTWRLILHHCSSPTNCHEHVITTFAGVDSGTFVAPDHEYPSYLELRLTATDAPTSADWEEPDWARRLPLTVVGSFSGGSQTEVPVLVRLDPTRIDDSLTAPGGADLRFHGASGEHLEHEIESWNPGGVSAVWVKLPDVSSASGDVFYLYYGNPNAADGQHAEEVWSGGYAAVWHLGADLNDSTGEGHHGVNHGSTIESGPMGGALGFDGTSAYVDLGPGLGFSGTLSLEAWFRLGDPGRNSYDRILSTKLAWEDPSGYNLEVQPAEGLLTALGSGADYLRGNVNHDGNWHYLASAVSGSSGSLYFDGVNVTSDTTIDAIQATSVSLNLGRAAGGTEHFLGQLDEIRVASVPRNAGWFALQNLSMRDELLQYGTPEVPSVLSATTNVILQPRTVEVTYETIPAGLTLSVGSQNVMAPYQKTSIDGGQVSVSAPLTQVFGGQTYTFQAWSDGGEPTHTFPIDAASTTLTATYAPQSGGPSCTDGVQNGLETGTDCGGPDCPPCDLCGDGSCGSGETCASCALDCGACPSCGDGSCNGAEDCSSCSADCGPCSSCGDGTCDANEECGTCTADCGACASCNDGLENGLETGVDCGGPDCPACPSSCNPISYPATSMTPSTGGQVADGWNIWSNGTLSVAHDFQAGGARLSVLARGEQAGGVWPNMVVSVGGTVVGSVSVNTAGMTPYEFVFQVSAGTRQISIEFTNDYYNSPEDRNLIVGSVAVSCEGSQNPTCGDGTCNGAETCASCAMDCGACSTCGNGSCDAGEGCSTCAADCGACPTCGDGTCNGAETCASCAMDCGACSTCSDGVQNGQETGIDCGGPVCPACDQACVGATYDASEMTPSTGGQVADGWNIWSNGTLATSHDFSGGATFLTVYARGEQAGGAWPNMVVSVGGTPVGSVSVNTAGMTAYEFSFNAPAGPEEIVVEFTNDFYQSPEDRNLIVGAVEVTCEGLEPNPVCGDGTCGALETCVTCATDCGACSQPRFVWLEAESGTLQGTPPFSLLTDGAASGGSYLQSTANSLTSPGASRASYLLPLEAGTYVLHLRVIAPNASQDSLWVSMDGGPFIRFNNIAAGNSWHWDAVHDSSSGDTLVSFSLAAGTHSLVVANREAGLRVDKLYMTSLGDAPTGAGQ